MYTTLNKILEYVSCDGGWEKLLKHLGKTQADDEPLSIATIIDSNGLDDSLWCLRAVDGHDKEIRIFAVWCARQVQHLMKDKRSIAALDIAELFANGEATADELGAAYDAAYAAARAAYKASRPDFAGAYASAHDAAYAAYAAAHSSSYAAYDAAYAAARDAYNAARAAQKQELLRICTEIDAEKGEK